MTATRGAACCLLLTAALVACGKDDGAPKGPPPTPEVDVVTLHAAPVTLLTELPGRLTAHRIAEMRPQVSGVVLQRLFTEGDMVQAGQQLYQIDPRPYQAGLASSQASLAKARAAAQSARLQVRRYRPLARAFAVSVQELDNAVATLGQDEADIASGQASVQTASINLAYTRMNAPISGRTGRSSITEGALVTAEQATSLVTITELDPIYVDVTQDSATALRLKREMAAGTLKQSAQGGAEVTLRLDDGSRYEHPGRLLFSEVSVDQSTGSVTLRALFPNPEGLLLPGMFVREQIQEGIRQAAFLVPQRGITHNLHGDAVAMVAGPDGRVAQRIVVAERAIGDAWLIDGGLAEGEHLIVDGLQTIHPGDTVRIHEVTVHGSDLIPVQPDAGAAAPTQR